MCLRAGKRARELFNALDDDGNGFLTEDEFVSGTGASTGLKVIRKFFLNHNKSFRWHLGDYEKHNFFSI